MYHCHIQCSVIQRSRGHSALRRLAYQTCDQVNDGFRRADYRKFEADHRADVILLPEGAPAKFAELCHFIPAIIAAERRADAQEGRAVDFAIPRAAPDRLLLPIAAFVMAPLAKMGMAVRIDIECPSASDERPNPHAHCYVSQRALETDGFGKKERSWDRFFRRDNARHIRALIAGRLTLACAILGIAAHVDPRRNDEIGAGAPEERLPPVLWRMRDAGRQVDAIQSLNVRRRAKSAARPEQRTEYLVVGSAAPFRGSRGRAVAAMKVVADWARARNLAMSGGPPPENPVAGERLRFGRGEVAFDGEAFQMAPGAGLEEASLVIELARALDWPALVVEGDAALADLIIVAGASEGLAAVNRPASPAAITLIAQRQFDDFVRQIAIHDPRGHITASLEGFVPTTPVVRLFPSGWGELERLPDDWQVQEDPGVRRRNAQFARDYADRQREKLDNLVNGMAKRRIHTDEVGAIRRESPSARGWEPSFLRRAREATHEEDILGPPADSDIGSAM